MMNFKVIVNKNTEKILEGIKSTNVLMRECSKLFLETFNDGYPDSIGIEIFILETGEKVGALEFKKRGLVKATNIPSMHCSHQELDRDKLLKMGLKEYKNEYKELRYIDVDNNSYKKYIIEGTDTETLARYGSIDVKYDDLRVVHYPKYMYYPLYFEKLSKGYLDKTSILKEREEDDLKSEASAKDSEDVVQSDASKDDLDLYDELLSYSKNFVKMHLEEPDKFTKRQIEESKKLFNKLKKANTLEKFNDILKELVILSPRKRNAFCGDKIKSSFARDENDFQRILDFEESLIIAMETVYNNRKGNVKKIQKRLTSKSFKDLDIEVYPANDKQRAEVLSYLSPSYQSRVTKIYRVKPHKQEEKFSAYVKANNIKDIRKLWHGSVNQNWLSIVENSLRITAKAANGRMFGDGVYFATSDDKSFGYTSSYGSRWANGNSNVAIMGLYATAYGVPEYPTGWGAQNYTEASLKKMGKNCVHAKAAYTGLRKDEIIFYNTDAIVLNYLVFFN